MLSRRLAHGPSHDDINDLFLQIFLGNSYNVEVLLRSVAFPKSVLFAAFKHAVSKSQQEIVNIIAKCCGDLLVRHGYLQPVLRPLNFLDSYFVVPKQEFVEPRRNSTRKRDIKRIRSAKSPKNPSWLSQGFQPNAHFSFSSVPEELTNPFHQFTPGAPIISASPIMPRARADRLREEELSFPWIQPFSLWDNPFIFDQALLASLKDPLPIQEKAPEISFSVPEEMADSPHEPAKPSLSSKLIVETIVSPAIKSETVVDPDSEPASSGSENSSPPLDVVSCSSASDDSLPDVSQKSASLITTKSNQDEEALQNAYEKLKQLSLDYPVAKNSQERFEVRTKLNRWHKKYDGILGKYKSPAAVSTSISDLVGEIEKLLNTSLQTVVSKRDVKLLPLKTPINRNRSRNKNKITRQVEVKKSSIDFSSSKKEDSMLPSEQALITELIDGYTPYNLKLELSSGEPGYSEARETALYDLLMADIELLKPVAELFDKYNKTVGDQLTAVIPLYYAKWIAICTDIVQELLALNAQDPDQGFDEGFNEFELFFEEEFELFYFMQEHFAIPLLDSQLKADNFFLILIKLYKNGIFLASNESSLPDFEKLKNLVVNFGTYIDIKMVQFNLSITAIQKLKSGSADWLVSWKVLENLAAEILRYNATMVFNFYRVNNVFSAFDEPMTNPMRKLLSDAICKSFKVHEVLMQDFLVIKRDEWVLKAMREKLSVFFQIIDIVIEDLGSEKNSPLLQKLSEKTLVFLEICKNFFADFHKALGIKPLAWPPGVAAMPGTFFKQRPSSSPIPGSVKISQPNTEWAAPAAQ